MQTDAFSFKKTLSIFSSTIEKNVYTQRIIAITLTSYALGSSYYFHYINLLDHP